MHDLKFDSLNHSLLTVLYEKYGFGYNIFDWIKFLFKNQESGLLIGGNTIRLVVTRFYFSVSLHTSFGNFASSYQIQSKYPRHTKKETIKILDAYISYNKKLQDDLNFFDSIKNIVNVIRL